MKLAVVLSTGLAVSAAAAPTFGNIFEKVLNKLSLDQIAKIRGGRYIGTATGKLYSLTICCYDTVPMERQLLTYLL